MEREGQREKLLYQEVSQERMLISREKIEENICCFHTMIKNYGGLKVYIDSNVSNSLKDNGRNLKYPICPPLLGRTDPQTEMKTSHN